VNNLIIISVIAKPGHAFVGYDLMQAIHATGMRFGAMNIFHYYLPKIGGTTPVFSLASMSEPGYFNWDKIGDFSCNGLCLFMDIEQNTAPEEIFALMVATAEQLADDLQGELRAGQNLPWNEDILKEYEDKLAAFSLSDT